MRQSLPRLTVVLPHLRAGGIERSAVLLLNALHGQKLRARVVVGRIEGPLVSDLDDSIELVELPSARAIKSLPALAQLMRNDCDIVYSGTNARNLTVLAAARLIPKRDRPKIMISEHTSPGLYLAQAKWPSLRRHAMRWLYPQATALLAPSATLAQDWLEHLNLNRPDPVGQPNPVLDPAALALSAAIATGNRPPRNPTRVLSVGRLHPAKGHDLAIRAVAKTPGVMLRIAGEGAEHAALIALAQDLGVADRVELVGHVADVCAEMAKAGALIVASRREGFGNVVIEALSTQTPVLATDCNGPKHLIGQVPDLGRIVPRNDPNALANALAQMQQVDWSTKDWRPAQALVKQYGAPAAADVFAKTIEHILAR